MWKTLWPASELPAGQVRIVEAEQTDILVYRTATGRVQAIEAWCPHMRNYMPNGLAPGRPLSDLLDGEEIQCPFHDWRFDGSGRCTGSLYGGECGKQYPGTLGFGQQFNGHFDDHAKQPL